jgi:hypothetical protein
MKKHAKKYTQCRLEKTVFEATIEQTAWIPSCFARVGNTIKIKKADVWVDGWKVVATYQSMDEVPHFELIRRTHRKKTGDSEPKVKRDSEPKVK